MKRNSILIYISVVLVTVMVFIWGCENQATDPQVAEGTQQDFSANGLKKSAIRFNLSVAILVSPNVYRVLVIFLTSFRNPSLTGA